MGSGPWDFGWCTILQANYIRRVDLINHGYGGYNTEWARVILPHILEDVRSPSLFTLFLGANDCTTEINKRQHVPLPRYSANIAFLLDTVKQKFPECRIVVISPPPMKEDQWEKQLIDRGEPYQLDRFNRIVKQYHQACCNVVTEVMQSNANVTLIDNWNLLLGPDYATLTDREIDEKLVGYLSDGLHFAKIANEKLAEKILESIKIKFPELHPDAISPSFTNYWEVDPDDLSTLFPKK
ncbi:isoamyl acetate-hydrolyzing esterase [Nowakowskiella sp. JEL0078]|nr:isoamyl acetate-hydrolyzing esterase [Nowakowskiella sp. JEL0078]